MRSSQPHITVFEHEKIRFDKGEKRISKEQFEALQSYYGDGVPYYNLCYNGVQFSEYVGAIQVGDTVIEVLPKADKAADSPAEETRWRNILIDMLRASGTFPISNTSDSRLKIKPNAILDLYFELFTAELEYLLRQGLVKKYRKQDSNQPALKGNLLFASHLQQNITHQERFFVRHTTFDPHHTLHCILYKALRLVSRINTNPAIRGRIGALLLSFPEMPDIRATEELFSKTVLNRKTYRYQKALEIARLLLMRYHPDLSKGRNHVLALMFDMNKLWEQFVFVTIRRNAARFNLTVQAQSRKYFWKPDLGNRSAMKPDIVINKGRADCVVLDTKWKNLNGHNPSPEDLRQLFVYYEYYNARKVALIYPGPENLTSGGRFLDPSTTEELDRECSVLTFAVQHNIPEWQNAIAGRILQWMDPGSFNSGN